MSQFTLFYGLDGQPISVAEASRLFEDVDARRVALDEIQLVGGGVARVSTVFLVLDHGIHLGDGPPVLWETMVFSDDDEFAGEYQARYVTREAAERGHRDTVEMIRSLRSPSMQVGPPSRCERGRGPCERRPTARWEARAGCGQP